MVFVLKIYHFLKMEMKKLKKLLKQYQNYAEKQVNALGQFSLIMMMLSKNLIIIIY